MSDFSADDELIAEFVVESREGLAAVDELLLALEADPSDIELVADIFRRIHTVKGGAGFLEFAELEALAHAGESLLASVRDGELRFDEPIATALLETVDALSGVLDSIEAGSTSDPNEPLIARLVALKDGASEDPVDPVATEQPVAEPPPEPEEDDAPSTPVAEIAVGATSKLVGQLLIAEGLIEPSDLSAALARQQAGDDRRIGEILHDQVGLELSRVEAAVNAALANATDEPEETETTATRPAPESSVRVDLGLLDDIVSLVGELVLTRNQMVQRSEEGQSIDTQALTHITSALQEQALRTRMQRIGSAWKSLPRVVRDVGKTAGKTARLEMSGDGIELDRTIIEAIRDPLLHLVRNAVDHGLEAPEARTAAGKDPVGTIRLQAVQDGGHVIVEVSDDGGGIDAERIATAAIERGLVSAADAAQLSEREKIELILAPGFSTAGEVTTISGRGVGMDVVATSIRQIRGSLEIRSTLGVGTTMRLAIPLTLAIVPALMVTSGSELFAVPQASVLELVRLHGQDLEERIEHVHDAPVLRLREHLLPLIDLAEVLGTSGEDTSPNCVVVLQSGDQPFGLVVDRVTKAEEIVVKPVSASVQSIGCYAGATVLGDGSAALILDVAALATGGGLNGTARVEAPEATDPDSDRTTMLVAEVAGRCAALPTADLERLEKVKPTDVEWSGDIPVVQYRDRLLPLVDLRRLLHRAESSLSDAPLRVIVTSERAETSLGLVVDQVLDVVEVDLDTVDRVGAEGRIGVVGSVVANGAVVDLLDIASIVQMIDNGPLAAHTEAAA